MIMHELILLPPGPARYHCIANKLPDGGANGNAEWPEPEPGGKAMDFAIRRAIDRSPRWSEQRLNSMIAVVDETMEKAASLFPAYILFGAQLSYLILAPPTLGGKESISSRRFLSKANCILKPTIVHHKNFITLRP